MDVKRFVGRDVRTALRLVREQMGPDAMILSNSRTAEGVEVVAAPFEVVNSLSKGPKGVLRDLGKVPDETGRRPLVALASTVGIVGLFLINTTAENALTQLWMVTIVWIVVRSTFGVLRVWPGIGASPFGKQTTGTGSTLGGSTASM